MAEPKKRLTSTRSGNRRSHLIKKSKSFAICSKCKEKIIPHKVCPFCGYYNNEDILKLEEKTKTKEEKKKKAEGKKDE